MIIIDDDMLRIEVLRSGVHWTSRALVVRYADREVHRVLSERERRALIDALRVCDLQPEYEEHTPSCACPDPSDA